MILVYGYLYINILLKLYLLYFLEYEDCLVWCEGIYIIVCSEYVYDRCVGYIINFNISGMLRFSFRFFICYILYCLLEMIIFECMFIKRDEIKLNKIINKENDLEK